MTVETSSFKMRKLSGDTFTAISLYVALQGTNKILFESNAKYTESGRYSFVAANPVAELFGGANETFYRDIHGDEHTFEIPVLEKLKQVMPIRKIDTPFSFFGGAIGYFGYETAYHLEVIGEVVGDVYNMPDVHVFFYDTFIVMDHLLQEVSIVAVDLFGGRSEADMDAALARVEEQLQRVVTLPETEAIVNFAPVMEKERFLTMVETAKEHIRRGDIFQVVLSQVFESDFEGDAFMLYRKLRTTNPSPYMYYIDFGNIQILGTSPESLVKVKQGIVTTNPIAGTKPRGATKVEDEAITAALLQDEKEIAEHKMLVDLGRNDVGRVSKIGSVSVTKYMNIERYKFVMHIVSEVIGELQEDAHVLDVLGASLPAGTVSGAPKIRAMQIINALEQKKRGIYSGAIGYISMNGDMDLALAIRTMVIKENKAYVQAGAGIVYDSIAESEYEETQNKARALLEVRR